MAEKHKYILSDEEKAEYSALLTSAYQAANDFSGAEDSYHSLIDKLILMENFVRARNDNKVDEDLETSFAKQSNYLASEFNTVSGIIGHASNRVYGMLSRLTDLKGLLNALQLGGAYIDYSDNVYVLTDQTFPSGGEGADIDENLKEFRKQPRLAILVKELNSIGIYTDDLIVRVGQVFEDKIRKLPYIVVEIPRLGKQVAVCDQYGETTFVSQNILHPNIWASFTKRQLKALDGVKPVPFGDSWPFKVCNLLAYGTDEMTPEQFRAPKKVDVSKFAREQRALSSAPVSEDIVRNHLIMHFIEAGEFPKPSEHLPVKTLKGEYWDSLNDDMINGRRGFQKGSNLLKVIRAFVREQGVKYREIKGEWPYRKDGTLPDYPDISWNDLETYFERKTWGSRETLISIFTGRDKNPEISDVARAMLLYAAALKPNPKLPSVADKSVANGFKNSSWPALNAAGNRGSGKFPKGMGMKAIARYYGWFDVQDNFQKEKLNADIVEFEESEELPEPVLTIEAAVLIPDEKNLSVELIAKSMLEYALKHNEQLPHADTEGVAPNINEPWKRLDNVGARGYRNIPEGMSLSAIKKCYGWLSDNVRSINHEKFNVDLKAFKETGQLPIPSVTIEEIVTTPKKKMLSISIIVHAMLEHAIAYEGQLPGILTEGAIPSLPGDNWRSVNQAYSGIRGLQKGFSLATIKRLYGWDGLYDEKKAQKLSDDMAIFAETGALPEPIMSLDKAASLNDKVPLSVEVVAKAMLQYASSHDDKALPVGNRESVPGLQGDNWATLDAAAKGIRGMPVGMTLAAIKRHYGWHDKNGHTQYEKVRNDVSVFIETGCLPEPVLSFEQAIMKPKVIQLSVESVARSMLKYAAVNDGNMPVSGSQDTAPDMDGYSWRTINRAGQRGINGLVNGASLLAIKRCYGWITGKRLPNPNKVRSDINRFLETGELPEPIISIEDAIGVGHVDENLTLEPNA